MESLKKCPICESELINKQVEKILRSGNNTAIITVNAEVCLSCGERLYTPETIKRFAQIRAKLTSEETADFQPIGQSFRVNAITA